MTTQCVARNPAKTERQWKLLARIVDAVIIESESPRCPNCSYHLIIDQDGGLCQFCRVKWDNGHLYS